MKNTTLNYIAALVVCLLFTTIKSHAQGMRYEVPLTEQVQSSSQIIEGKVIAQQSYWDANHDNIYTINTIEVYKIFKGETISTLELITNGGIVGLEAETVVPSLQLLNGNTGVFMLHASPVHFNNQHVSTSLKYRTYSESQGFYLYDIENNKAINPFHIKDGITESFYDEIKNLTQTDYIEMNPFDVISRRHDILENRRQGGTAITSFSPTTATAGTKTQITITGTDFGSSGTVRFSRADDGGATFADGLPTEIISWSATEIVVRVNQDAGTGPIQVVANGTATSSQTLNVPYAELNANYDPGTGTEAYLTQHIDRDGSGGYVWQMQTDFDASAANDAFVRSLDTWRCETEINWTVGAVTTTDVIANDNINIVRFDNGTELPNGVLGRCTSRWSGCGGATIKWYVEELDIVFNDDTNWNYATSAPGFTQYDFESVSVHELGHGHQFGHVIDTNAIMHYSISNGEENRALSSNDIAAGADVQSRSTVSAVCGQSLMTSFDCATLSAAEFSLADNIALYPNPVKENMFIRSASNIKLTGANIYDVTGKIIMSVDLTKMNKLKTLNVSSLSTGMYFVNINSDKGLITKKIIIE